MFISTFPTALLITLLTGYNSAIAEKYGEITAPIEFLTEKGGADALPALMEKRKKLAGRLEKYECLLNDRDIGVPTLYEYAIATASDKVRQAFQKYKEEMLSKGAECVFGDAYYINIAANIVYFFNELEDSGTINDEDMARILGHALQDNFFENIMRYVLDVDSFDVSSLERTTEEIESYCRLITYGISE